MRLGISGTGMTMNEKMMLDVLKELGCKCGIADGDFCINSYCPLLGDDWKHHCQKGDKDDTGL